MHQTTRIIRRYGNRRLYDFGISRYITLREVYALTRKGIPLKVVDGARRDITREVLLQVLLEQEKAGAPRVTREQLVRLVRSGKRTP